MDADIVAHAVTRYATRAGLSLASVAVTVMGLVFAILSMVFGALTAPFRRKRK